METPQSTHDSIGLRNLLLALMMVLFITGVAIVGFQFVGPSIFEKDNGYIWFDGKNSGITLNANTIDLEEGMLTVWVRADEVGSQPRVILLSSSNPNSDGFGEASPDHDFSLGIIAADNPRAPGRLEWTFQTSTGGATLRSTNPFPVGSWHHIALIWKGRGRELQLLIDGSVDVKDTIGLAMQAVSERPLYEQTSIGLPFNVQSNRGFAGGMDELRIWNSAQSPFSIAWSMRKEINPQTKGLLAYWRFNTGQNMLQEEVNGIVESYPIGKPLWYPGK
ncbi:LamG domain-containing protein [Candidatus Roizmanbacteria bacterium]|nr:LamG domain-containing protein [Candidatus Roizmanbacteria bacterium]